MTPNHAMTLRRKQFQFPIYNFQLLFTGSLEFAQFYFLLLNISGSESASPKLHVPTPDNDFHNSEYLISYIPFSIQMIPLLSASFISLLIRQLFTPLGSTSLAILPVGIVV